MDPIRVEIPEWHCANEQAIPDSQFYYYLKPDGQDILQKIKAAVGLAFIPCIGIAGTYSIARYRNISQQIFSTFQVLAKVGTVSFVFATTTFMATRIRGDSPLNHAIGTFATAPFIKSFFKLPAYEVGYLVTYASIFMALAKLRHVNKDPEYGDGFKYLGKGFVVQYPHFDYWDYISGKIEPTDDYAD